jgi:hypothetical protein
MKVKPPRDKLSFSPEGNKKNKRTEKSFGKEVDVEKKSLLTKHKLFFVPNSFGLFGTFFWNYFIFLLS